MMHHYHTRGSKWIQGQLLSLLSHYDCFVNVFESLSCYSAGYHYRYGLLINSLKNILHHFCLIIKIILECNMWQKQQSCSMLAFFYTPTQLLGLITVTHVLISVMRSCVAVIRCSQLSYQITFSACMLHSFRGRGHLLS